MLTLHDWKYKLSQW